MKKSLMATVALVIAIGMILTACGTSGNNAGKGNKKDFKVGMVTDVGGVNDKSFNQSAWEGLQKFGKDFDLEKNTNYKYLQSTKQADYQPNLNQLVHSDFDLVFGIGYLMQSDVQKVAEQNKKAKLAIVDSVVDAPNVASINFKEEEGSFLVGVIAGKMTKTNKIGFIGGIESDLIKKFENGFKAGVKSVNPNAEIFVQYAGAFDKADQGQAIAATFYGKGADIIYHAAGATGNGVFTEAKTRKKDGQNVWVIGVDRDQYDAGLPEDVTLTSMVKHVDQAVYDVSKMTMEGNFPGGKVLRFGLKENGVGIADHKEHIPDDVLKLVDDYKNKIINGDIKPPATDKDYEAFVKNLK